MATNAPAREPVFNELVVQGTAKVVRAFLGGLVLGSGRQATVFYSHLEGVHHEGKVERFAELVGVREADCHVIVDAETATWLRGLSRTITAETGLVLAANRRIRSASLAIRYEAFGKRHDDEILALLGQLPPGLKLSDFRHDEHKDPDANETAAYAPAHAFEARGQGMISGRIDLLIAFRRRLADFPLVVAADIALRIG